ncbi:MULTISPECIES: hypothetical protein [Corynebacterium]|uniref:hypothetical protein n=1 Tax=Corynebacterium TaxID=1716 RepID=UPI00195889D5|nr:MULTISPECIES: hypothetical protein [Corynebacterium]MDN8624211.1 hypothetical protein [Corynebacterium kroppenstedtii]QRQ65781.1 hypothetical protein I6J23_05055 [Corynebacterium kroppenstedtii]
MLSSKRTPHRATTATPSNESRPTSRARENTLPRSRRLGTWVAITMSGVVFLQGCTISHHDEKESESEKQMSEFKERNAKYSAHNNDGSGPNDSIRWVDRTKTSPLILVAPHATNHHRRGQPKVADLYTGGITEMVADKLNVSALTTTGKVSDWHDNWKTRDDKFTRVLKGLPDNAIVVELHGMDDSSSEEPVSVGTGDRPSPMTDDIVRRLSETLHGQVDIDAGFNAQASYTVTDFMQKRGHSAMQIEMNHAIRDPKQGQTPTTIARLSTAFREALTDLPTLDTKPTREQDAPAPNIDKVRESEKEKPSSKKNSTSLEPEPESSSSQRSTSKSSQRSSTSTKKKSKSSRASNHADSDREPSRRSSDED